MAEPEPLPRQDGPGPDRLEYLRHELLGLEQGELGRELDDEHVGNAC